MFGRLSMGAGGTLPRQSIRMSGIRMTEDEAPDITLAELKRKLAEYGIGVGIGTL